MEKWGQTGAKLNDTVIYFLPFDFIVSLLCSGKVEINSSCICCHCLRLLGRLLYQQNVCLHACVCVRASHRGGGLKS